MPGSRPEIKQGELFSEFSQYALIPQSGSYTDEDVKFISFTSSMYAHKNNKLGFIITPTDHSDPDADATFSVSLYGYPSLQLKDDAAVDEDGNALNEVRRTKVKFWENKIIEPNTLVMIPSVYACPLKLIVSSSSNITKKYSLNVSYSYMSNRNPLEIWKMGYAYEKSFHPLTGAEIEKLFVKEIEE